MPGDLKVAAKGRNVTWTMAPAVLPIRPIVVIDAPVAPSGQCADRPFAACAVTGGGRAIHCR